MTKVLFWNIEQFKADRINSSSNKLVPGAGNLTEQEAANQRRSLIYDTLAATNPKAAALPWIKVDLRVPSSC